MQIPFVDLKAQLLSIQPEIEGAIKKVLDEADFIGGQSIKDFESAFAKAYDVKNVIAVGNGTDAIYIVLKMLGIGAGDEVITSASSWISTSETISQTGARPVFVDIDPVTFTIDPTKIEAKITSKTKAIIPVHLYGQMAHIQAINQICKKHNLFLIEDCAQSHFSKEGEALAGKTGIAGTFSFYPGKNLGAYGDAGCIITQDEEFAKRCRMYANHGSLKKHEHQIEGINSRLDTLQAAILNVKLKYILSWTAARIEKAKAYTERLQNIPQLAIPQVRPGTTHTFHLYVVRTTQRDQLKDFLKDKGVNTAIHYPAALPNLQAYRYLGHSPDDFPVATRYQNEILSLPIFPELNIEQIEYVCKCIRDFFSQARG